MRQKGKKNKKKSKITSIYLSFAPILLLQMGVRLTIMILKKIRKNTQTHKHTNTQYTHNTQNETMKTTHQKEKETTK